MQQKLNSVFISYRRSTSRYLARLVFNDLYSNAFDPFLDVRNLESGEFGRIILREIPARAHFVFLVSQGSLQRCASPTDWLRREFEEAVRTKRHIVPVYDEDVSVDSIRQLLVGPLERLPQYNGITIYHEYFDAGMERLRGWLSEPVIVTVEERDATQQAAADERIESAVSAGAPTDNELAAERAFNAAWQTGDTEERIRLFSEAIEADPSYAAAYFDRANTYRDVARPTEALADYDRAVTHNPDDPDYRVARGRLLKGLDRAADAQKDFDAAVALYTAEIGNTPRDLNLYLARAAARKQAGDPAAALADYSQVIDTPEDQLEPLWEGESGEEYKHFPVVNALWARALLRFRTEDYQGTIDDCSRMIKMARNKPDFGDTSTSIAYTLRGTAHGALGHRVRAISDLRAGAAMGEEGLGTFFTGFMLAWPLVGKYLDAGDPLEEMKPMFHQMADDL